MSARKKRQNAEAANGSARNLDGRRMRTITEAKNLATYLATKPEMDKKEKEERRKRWEQVIDLAEQREADMRAGKGPDGRRKGLSDQWVDEKEEVGESVRNAVKQAMLAIETDGKGKPPSRQQDESSGSGGSEGASDEDSDADQVMELDESEMSRLRAEAEGGDADAIWVLKEHLKIPSHLLPKTRTQSARRFAGFDDDDDDDDDDEDDDLSDEDQGKSQNKGKQKAIPA